MASLKCPAEENLPIPSAPNSSTANWPRVVLVGSGAGAPPPPPPSPDPLRNLSNCRLTSGSVEGSSIAACIASSVITNY